MASERRQVSNMTQHQNEARPISLPSYCESTREYPRVLRPLPRTAETHHPRTAGESNAGTTSTECTTPGHGSSKAPLPTPFRPSATNTGTGRTQPVPKASDTPTGSGQSTPIAPTWRDASGHGEPGPPAEITGRAARTPKSDRAARPTPHTTEKRARQQQSNPRLPHNPIASTSILKTGSMLETRRLIGEEDLRETDDAPPVDYVFNPLEYR